jgi:hypothetical protein
MEKRSVNYSQINKWSFAYIAKYLNFAIVLHRIIQQLNTVRKVHFIPSSTNYNSFFPLMPYCLVEQCWGSLFALNVV